MTFNVAAEAYDQFMGGWSRQLSAPFADFAGIESGHRVLDVGCGPGILTAELVDRLGADAVSAVDPSEPFVAAPGDCAPAPRRRRLALRPEFQCASRQMN